MDHELEEAAKEGNVQILQEVIERNPWLLQSVTIEQNTALHIAVSFGRQVFTEKILKEDRALLIMMNDDGDTPLHIAARSGYVDIVKLLIKYAKDWPTDMKRGEVPVMLMTNMKKNTALHEAVKHQELETAKELLRAEPSTGYMANIKKETPLHIAAKQGLMRVVEEILQVPWVAGPEEQLPPLHQAVLGGHPDIVEMLLFVRSDFIKVNDAAGNTALHYAALKNDPEMVNILFRKMPPLAFLKNNEGRSSLHVAVAFGSISAIKELLKLCPKAAERVDASGKNALHIAVTSPNAIGSLECLLKSVKEQIINQTDDDENTPLHLAAKQASLRLLLVLMKDERVDPLLKDKKGRTAQKIFDEMETHEERTKDVKEAVKNYTSSLLVIATLITTVSFAAAFTMPGGYINDGPDQGTAILVRRTAFKVFLIFDTISMCSSMVAVYLIMPFIGGDLLQYPTFMQSSLLIVIANISMLGSFTAAVYVVIYSQFKLLAILIIGLDGLTAFIAAFIFRKIFSDATIYLAITYIRYRGVVCKYLRGVCKDLQKWLQSQLGRGRGMGGWGLWVPLNNGKKGHEEV